MLVLPPRFVAPAYGGGSAGIDLSFGVTIAAASENILGCARNGFLRRQVYSGSQVSMLINCRLGAGLVAAAEKERRLQAENTS